MARRNLRFGSTDFIQVRKVALLRRKSHYSMFSGISQINLDSDDGMLLIVRQGCHVSMAQPAKVTSPACRNFDVLKFHIDTYIHQSDKIAESACASQ